MTQVFRILLIDDNSGDRTLASRALSELLPQAEIQEVLNDQEFSQQMELGDLAAVVTDYQLVWTTGLDILRRVKEYCPNCPVIMFTGTGNEEIAVEAMKAGLDDYILKRPNRYPYLATVVQVALERAETRRRAELLEIRLQRLLDRLTLGVFRTNAAGELLESNAAFLQLLGVDSLEQAQALLQPLNLPEKIAELSQTAPPYQQIEWEIQLQQADETRMWVLLNATLSYIDGERVLDGLVENITVRKNAEIVLQRLSEELETRVQERTAQLETTNRELSVVNQRLEVANRDLEEFASTVSHDLQSPLRVIQGFSQIILNEYANDISASVRDYVERILRGADRGRLLIQDLLNYGRLGRNELSLQGVNLDFVIAESLNQLEEFAQQTQAQIQIEQPLGVVQGEYRILVQVLTNLLSNAMKFMPPDRQPQIRVWSEERNGQNRLWVEDNGIGIAADKLDCIFDIFERLYTDETYPGTGVGLAIVRKGIERMNGRVGVESQPGQGSQFWIELPKAN
jgi:signal transduction histidine kinase